MADSTTEVILHAVQTLLSQNAMILARLHAMETTVISLAEEAGHPAGETLAGLRADAEQHYERILFLVSDRNPAAADAIDQLGILKRRLNEEPPTIP